MASRRKKRPNRAGGRKARKRPEDLVYPSVDGAVVWLIAAAIVDFIRRKRGRPTSRPKQV